MGPLVLLLLLAPGHGPPRLDFDAGVGSSIEGACPEVQEADTIPSDTYADEGTRALLERARAARSREEGGLESYEGVLRERFYVGFSGLTFRRERSLVQSERVARIRWSREGGRVIQWIGSRNEVPILGPGGSLAMDMGGREGRRGSINLQLRSGGEEGLSEETKSRLQESIRQNLNPLLFHYRPGDDRLVFGDDFALHPLADSAVAHYRYRPGDTLRIELPTEDRTVTLVEVRVEPREARFQLLAGSLWFDPETGALARASYRPSRPLDLEEDRDEDVPGILSPVQVDFDYFTVEYSLQDFQWWLPRRFSLDGEVRLGRLLRLPLVVEWSVGDYLINTEETLILGPEELPQGWVEEVGRLEPEEGPTESVRVIVPPLDSLWHSAALTGEMLGPSPIAFTDEEIDGLRGELEELIPGHDLFRPRTAWGLADRNLRYNRVEGLSIGASARLPLSSRYSLEPRIRVGLADQVLRGALSLHRGSEDDRLSLTVFRRLAHTADFGDPLSLGTSLSNLLFRNAHTHFYQATGGDLGLRKLGRRTRLTGRLFWEDQEAVQRETSFYLWRPFTGDTLPLNLPADEGRVMGVSGDLRWQLGTDPAQGVVSGLLRGEVGEGDFSYQRALATLAFSRPLVLGTALAVEVGAGAGWGELPIQKNFFLGGANTLRGYAGSFVRGESFWMARGELGTGISAVRLALFSDLGWAGPREGWKEGRALWSVGGGLSFLDGLVRLDLAWPKRHASGMRFYFYMDALF